MVELWTAGGSGRAGLHTAAERRGDGELPSEYREWEEVYAAIQAGQPVGLALLGSFLQKYPDDPVARYHAAQLRELVRAASA